MRQYPISERRRMTAAYLQSIGYKGKKGPDVEIEKTGVELEPGATVIGGD